MTPCSATSIGQSSAPGESSRNFCYATVFWTVQYFHHLFLPHIHPHILDIITHLLCIIPLVIQLPTYPHLLSVLYHCRIAYPWMLFVPPVSTPLKRLKFIDLPWVTFLFFSNWCLHFNFSYSICMCCFPFSVFFFVLFFLFCFFVLGSLDISLLARWLSPLYSLSLKCVQNLYKEKKSYTAFA